MARARSRGTPRWARLLVVVVNTFAAIGVAAYASASPIARRHDAALHLSAAWGAALAAILALVAVVVDAATLGWVAVGYLLWAAVLGASSLGVVFLALAVSLMPVVPRPRGSLGQGLIVAFVTAVVIDVARHFI